ncbi:MAG: Gfo/Idh/MocA family oxidoreductase [Planctomycetota bacterium]
MSEVRIAQVGARGFGRIHLERIDRLAAAGRARLVAVADPAGAPKDRRVPWYPSLEELLARHAPDVVSIATPIGTHAALALLALDAGADVFLEKPPVASLEDFRRLLRRQEETGRLVQVGFQSLGGEGVARMRGLMESGALGVGAGLRARGCWVRDRAYYARSAWAGKRLLNGTRVADGVATNPLAHAVATAFAIAGVRSPDDIAEIETELYHAHDIESDDTAWVRVRPAHGEPIVAALTLCGREQIPPTVTLSGPRGRASLSYAEDRIDRMLDGVHSRETFGSIDLLENLLDARERPGEAALLAPLAGAAGFMAVLEATQDRPAPSPIPLAFVEWRLSGQDAHPVVAGIESWLDRCLEKGCGFAAAGAPWANPGALHRWRPARAGR